MANFISTSTHGLKEKEKREKKKRTARLPLFSFLDLFRLFSSNLILFLFFFFFTAKRAHNNGSISFQSLRNDIPNGNGNSMRTFTTYLVLRLLGPSGFLFRVSSLGGHGLYLNSCGCVCARFSKFGLKKDVEVVRRVLSVERKQMDRRMEKWAWDERCVCVWWRRVSADYRVVAFIGYD